MFEDFDDDDGEEDFEAEASAKPASLLLPRAALQVVGHAGIEERLLAAFNDSRLPHALVFAGPAGIGKATFAFRLARFLLARGEEVAEPGLFGAALPAAAPVDFAIAADHPVVRQVASGGHADLLVVERLLDEKKGRLQDVVAVDEVRKITPFLRLTAGAGGWRVVIVDDADTMNRASQNALLKILEEPPPRTVLILVAHNVGTLLPTIRSRARAVNFTPLNAADFAGLIRLGAPDLNGDDLELLRAIAGGSVGSALRLHREGALAHAAQLSALLEKWPRWPWEDIHKLADRLGAPGQDDAYKVFVEIFLWLLRGFVRAGATGSTPPSATAGAVRILAEIGPAALLATTDALATHFSVADYANLDRRQAVLGAFTLLGKSQNS